MKGKSYSKAITAAIVTQIFWGLSFLASSIGQESASPFVLMSYRFDIALLALTVPVLLGKQKLDLRGKSIKPLLLLGSWSRASTSSANNTGLNTQAPHSRAS